MKCTQCGAQVEGDFCPYCGTAAEVKTQENNEQQPKIEMPKLSNNSENKAKKPFYKKWWVWVIAAIVIFGIIGKLGGNNGSSVDISEFEWDNMALAEVLPEPASNLGSNLINTEDYLSVDVHEITKDAYKEYVDACREKGFTVEVSEYDGYYDASNEAGFELMLYYFEDEQKMSIDLTAPSEDTNKETEDEKISFTLIAGEVGDYGEKIVFNKGTDMEIERIYYHIPAGTYTVTNVGEYMSQVNVYSDEIHKNEDGWEEPVVAYENQMLDVNKSTSITIDDSQAVYISEPAKFKFEGSIVKSSNNAEGSETSNTDTTDTTGHGTKVAGIIAAKINNNEGLCGIADKVKIVPFKVFNAQGGSSDLIIADAVIRAVDDFGCDVINLSLSSPDESYILEMVIDYALSKGCIVIASAGNNDTQGDEGDHLRYPAAQPGVIAVGSTDKVVLE